MDINYISGRSEVLLCADVSSSNAQHVYKLVSKLEGLPEEDFYLTCNGKLLSPDDELSSSCTVRSNTRIVGGKGGFGSMLRAIGARIEKTTNHEACRDLSGRRMRDVNNEKHITEWLKDKEDKEAERVKKRQEKLERIMNPKYSYDDKGYTSNLQQNADNIDEALKQALKNHKVKSGDKRKTNEMDEKIGKKSKMSWIGLDEEDVDDESDDEEKIVSVEPTNEKSNNENEIVVADIENSDIQNTSDKNSDLNALPIQESDLPKETHTNTVQNDEANLKNPEVLDLTGYNSPEQLEALGLDRLKSALIFLGLKCGGTLQDRSQRLYLTKDTSLDKLDLSLFAKSSKKKKNKKN